MDQTSTQFTQQEYALAYPDGLERHYWHLCRNFVVKHQLTNLGSEAGFVLEVGCGRGLVIDYLNQQGIDCVGAELAEVVPLERVHDKIFTGADANTLPEELRKRVNTILLLDVLEHLQQPTDFLADLM